MFLLFVALKVESGFIALGAVTCLCCGFDLIILIYFSFDTQGFWGFGVLGVSVCEHYGRTCVFRWF